MRFFTADLHFGHGKVIEYCNRPFKDVYEMNAELIRRWNVLVTPADTVFVLGDFSFMNSGRTKEVLRQLQGTIHLIRGNHDQGPHRFFERVDDAKRIEIGGYEVNLSHFPYFGKTTDGRDFSSQQLSDNGLPLLHGHVHCEWKVRDKMINVGVDQWAYAPVSETEILEVLKKL